LVRLAEVWPKLSPEHRAQVLGIVEEAEGQVEACP